MDKQKINPLWEDDKKLYTERGIGKTKSRIIELVGIMTEHYVSFSMWAEKHQKEYIEKKEKNYFSSGYYRGFISGLFETEHDNTIQENISVLLPHYFEAVEEAKKNPPKQTRKERKIEFNIYNNWYEEQHTPAPNHNNYKAPTMRSRLRKGKRR